MTTLPNVAVFVGRKRRYVSVDVVIDGEPLTARIIQRKTNTELISYTIIETVKEGEAWDVLQNGQRVRLVAQAGCGCGGMRRYKADPSYSGALPT